MRLYVVQMFYSTLKDCNQLVTEAKNTVSALSNNDFILIGFGEHTSAIAFSSNEPETDIAAQLDMYGNIYDRLNQMINKGRGPLEAAAAAPAKEYEAKMGNPDEFIRRSAESLWAYLSPDA